MNNKRILYGGLTFGIVLVLGLMVFVNSLGVVIPGSENKAQSIEYHSMVCKQITRANGAIENSECSHNQLFNLGANATRDILGAGSSYGAMSNISLCNSTAGASVGCAAPTAAASEAFNVAIGCGLDPAAGSYSTNPTVGNWTISKTFTSSCNAQTLNVTRIGNATAYFAGNSFSTPVTLQANDQITVNWTIWVA